MSEASEKTPASPIIFEIVQADSEARFLIDEVLRGNPNTVIGATDQVAGQFAINPADLSTVQVGIMQVNARTLATDNNFRNQAIKNFVLLTDDHEFITFTPTKVAGLAERGVVGETYIFQLEGDLAVTDVTQPVTFDVTATPISETRMVWLSNFGTNALVSFDPVQETFEVFPLPSPGANVRQILGRPGEVWGAESGTDKLVVIRTS